ncbi:beta-glucosidase 24 [Phtheirospermum japonicum]|uniref:Beta-glucosidase 24 n=1 Tax=Phtheirospermum japonicum TaxID=374723 RepID=A0A830CQI8_9LAMI|nr:beta-glucosidase 24 [Phtheirospermum japonicum]
MTRNHFPDDFVFGTGTSAYQVCHPYLARSIDYRDEISITIYVYVEYLFLQNEGGAAKGGRGLSVWDVFTLRTPGKITDGSNGNVAVDMYSKYKEDIKMMKSMGFDSYRFSISWPRILPGGKLCLGVNQEGVDFYNDLINTLLDNGIQPYVTLFHWDLPYFLEKEYGGFLSENIVEDFRDYAELCFWEFGDRVKYWFTLNEPWTYSVQGYVARKKPLKDQTVLLSNKISTSDRAKEAYTVARNLLLAHAAAVESYRNRFQEHQKGKIGITLVTHWFVPFNDTDEDKKAAKRAIDFMLGWFLEPVLSGRYPKNLTDFVPREYLKPFSAEESKSLKGSIDFLGLNYYTSWYATNDPDPDADEGYYKDQQVKFLTEKDGKPIGESTGSWWLYIVPWGIYKLLKYVNDTYNNNTYNLPAIYITENGCDEPNNPKLTAYEACRDKRRVSYFRDHLGNILKAMKETKLKVRGYFAWTLADNFEWKDGYSVRFGIIYVDYMNHLKRYPKDSAVWFTKFLVKKKIVRVDEY